jgi:hypothetical protein
MRNFLACAALSACLLCGPLVFAEDSATDCSFQDGKQISIRYSEVPSKKNAAKARQVWAPGDKPMTLFTQTSLMLGDKSIPAGAYTLYVIPDRDDWTLVVNKNVKDDAKYDASQDLARAKMPTAELNTPVNELKLTLTKAGPEQCNLRVYYSKIGTYGAEFKEKQ